MIGIDTGNTAWVLIAAAMVFFMTPGLALFYGGMARSKNVLSTIMQSFFLIGVISVEFMLIGYTLIFGDDVHGIIGSLNKIGLILSYIPLIPTLQIAFYLLLGSISFVLFLYLSISIGQLFQNHRILMSFVAAFVLWIIIGVLNRQLYFTNPFIYAITYAQYVGSYSEPPIQFSFLSAYTYEIIKLLLFYFGVYYITRTKLNLE